MNIIPIPLPPLPEQHRIVAKIEELFSKLDAGVAELKRYRQSVLHAAVTGELSRGWREAQGDELEDAGHLLTHILEERRSRWAASGKKGKYAEPQGPEVTGLPELPSGWVWASFQQLGYWSGGGTPHKLHAPYWENGSIYWVSPKDMKSRQIYFAEDKITSLAVKELTSINIVPPGSLLFVMRSGIIRRVLPTALTTVHVTVNQDMKALQFSVPEISEYVLIYSEGANDKIRQDCMKSGTTVESIEFQLLLKVSLPLPPLPEQSYIVTEVERRLSILANVEATVEAELKRAESTRQGILRRAFAGQLVPQDAADEPASVLLERIQAERLAAGAAAVRATGKRGRKAKTAPQVTLLGPADA